MPAGVTESDLSPSATLVSGVGFESLGADHPRYTPRIMAAGKVLAVAIAGGFMLIPIILFLAGDRA